MTNDDEGSSEDGLPTPSAADNRNGACSNGSFDEVSAATPVQLRRAFFEKKAFRKDAPYVVAALESPVSSARRTPKASNSVNSRWPIPASSSSSTNSSSSKSDQVIDTPPTGRKWKVKKSQSTMPAHDLKEEKNTSDKPLVTLPLSPLPSAANKESEKVSTDTACGASAGTKLEEQAPSSTEIVAEISKTQHHEEAIEKSTSATTTQKEDDISAVTSKETDESSKEATVSEPLEADSVKESAEVVMTNDTSKIAESDDVAKQSKPALRMTSITSKELLSTVVVEESTASTSQLPEDVSVTTVSKQQQQQQRHVIENSTSSTEQEKDDISAVSSRTETYYEASKAAVDEPQRNEELAEAATTDVPKLAECDDAKKQSETLDTSGTSKMLSATTPVVELPASTKQTPGVTVAVTKVSKDDNNLKSSSAAAAVVAKKSSRKSTGTLGVQTFGASSKPLDAIATPRKMVLRSPALSTSAAAMPRSPAFSQLRNVWANKAANGLDPKDKQQQQQKQQRAIIVQEEIAWANKAANGLDPKDQQQQQEQQQRAITIQEELDSEEEKKEEVPDACMLPFPTTPCVKSTEEETEVKLDDEECNSTISSHMSHGRIAKSVVFPSSSGQGDVPHVISRHYESPAGAAATDATDTTNNDDYPVPKGEATSKDGDDDSRWNTRSSSIDSLVAKNCAITDDQSTTSLKSADCSVQEIKDDQSAASTLKSYGCPMTLSKDMDDRSIASSLPSAGCGRANKALTSTLSNDKDNQSIASRNSTKEDAEDQSAAASSGEIVGLPVAVATTPTSAKAKDDQSFTAPTSDSPLLIANVSTMSKDRGDQSVSLLNSEKCSTVSKEAMRPSPVVTRDTVATVFLADTEPVPLVNNRSEPKTYGQRPVNAESISDNAVEQPAKVNKKLTSSIIKKDLKYTKATTDTCKEVTSPVVALLKLKFGEVESAPKVTSPVALMKIKFGEGASAPKVVKEVTSPVALLKKNFGERELVSTVGKKFSSPVALMKKKFGEVEPLPELVETPKSPGVAKLREVWGDKAAERRHDNILDQDILSSPEEKKKEDSFASNDSQKWVRRQSRNKALAASFKKKRATSPRFPNKVNTSKTAEELYTLSTPVSSMAANGSWRNDDVKQDAGATAATRWVPYHRFFTATEATISETAQASQSSDQPVPSTACAIADAPRRDPADPPYACVVENVYSEEGRIAPGLLQRADPPGKKTKSRRKRKESVLTDEIPEPGAPWMSIEVVVESSSNTVTSTPAGEQTTGAEFCFQEPRPKALKRDPSVDSSVWTKDDASLDWIGSMVSMAPKTSARLNPCSSAGSNFTTDLDRPTVLDITVDSKPPIYGRAKKELSSKSPNFEKPWSVGSVSDIENSAIDVAPTPIPVGSNTMAMANDTISATVPEAASKPVVVETALPQALDHSALHVIKISEIDKVPTPTAMEPASATSKENAPIASQPMSADVTPPHTPDSLVSVEVAPPHAPDILATDEVISNQLDVSRDGTCSSDCDDFEAMLRSDAKIGDDIVNSVEVVTVECKKEKTRVDTSIIIQEMVEQPASSVEIKDNSAVETPLQDAILSESTCLENVEATSTATAVDVAPATEQVIEEDTPLDALPIPTQQTKADAETCEIDTVPTVSETTTYTDEKKDIVESEHEHSTIDMTKSAHSMLEHARRTAEKIKEAKALTGQFSSMAEPGNFRAPESFVQQTIKRFEAEQNASYVPSHPMVKQVVSSWEAKNSSDMSSVAKAESFLSSLSGTHNPDDAKEDKRPCSEVKVKSTIASLSDQTPKTDGSDDKSQRGLNILATTPTLEEPALSTPLLPALSTPLASNVKASTVDKVGTSSNGPEDLALQYAPGKKLVGVNSIDKKCEEKDKISSSKVMTSILREPSTSRREIELSSENVEKLAARWDPSESAEDTDTSIGKSSLDISVAVNQDVYSAGMALVTMEQRALKKRELSKRTELLMTDSTDAGALTLNASVEDLQLPVVDQTRCLGDTACSIM